MATQHFTEEPRYLALMPAVHASLELFNRSNSSDPSAVVLAYVLEQLVAVLDESA